LNGEETSSYVLHRLNIAGRPDGNIFSPAALKRVFQCSGGVPRRVNLICDRALLTAYSEERGVVSRRDVNQAVKELAGMGEGSQGSYTLPWKAIVAATVTLLVVLAASSWFFPVGKRSVDATVLQPEPTPAPITVREPSPVPAPEPVVQPDSLIASCNALFSLWGAPLLSGDASSAGFDFDREFADRGLGLVRLAGRFDELINFNVPLLLPLSDEQGGGYLAVLEQTAPDAWSVEPSYQGKKTLRSVDLNRLGMRMAFVPWVDFASIGNVVVPSVNGENVRRLQFLLGLTTGCMDLPTNGRFGPRTTECVKDFQREQGLVVDGLVGPRTLILLYQTSGAYNMPRLSS
jgi:general secretion pathway protein A